MIFGNPKVTFTTEPDLFGVIPEPIPARTMLPDWFKKIKPWVNDDPDSGERWPTPSIKRCPPVLDAMSVGWIIGTPCDIDVIVNEDGSGVEWRAELFPRPVFEEHGQHQLKGHPSLPKPALKLLNYWHMKTPPGWSTLFVPPINREAKYFEAMAGLVDTDKHDEYVNFPGFLTVTGTTVRIPRGYPVVQAIPFRRGAAKKADVRAMTKKELDRMDFHRRRYASENSLYRDKNWERK